MGQQFRIQRFITNVQAVAAQAVTIDLPRGYDYESLILRLNGGIQVTTGATSVRAEAPAQAIARVEVIADGRNTLYSAPYWFGVLGNAYTRRQNENGARYLTPPSAASIATYQVEAVGVIDFQTADGMRGKDSNFRTSALQLFQARFTFGNAIDVFVPGAGVAVFNALFVEVSSSEMIEIADANGNITVPNLLKKVSFQEIGLPASNVNQEVRLPAGNLIKSVVVRTEGLTTAGEPTTGVVQNLIASSGVDVRINLTGGGVRAKNNADFGFITPGYYILDFVRSGDWLANLSELWDVTRQAEPKVYGNVVGGATVKAQLVVTEFLAVPK